MMLYAIYSYYGGWNRLYQYPATRYYEIAQRMLANAKARHPKGRYVIREVNA